VSGGCACGGVVACNACLLCSILSCSSVLQHMPHTAHIQLLKHHYWTNWQQCVQLPGGSEAQGTLCACAPCLLLQMFLLTVTYLV
jgi:hypothetical protein